MASTTDIATRNNEIMDVVYYFRVKRKVTMARCAQEISVGLKRYRLMERGERLIGAADLEVLMRFLDIPADAIKGRLERDNNVQEVLCRVLPGQRLNITVLVGEQAE
jgi:transcriptional regulator with XRE-family HTH domain